jgi:protein-S-isoprenylcysteine O-methyltransferase Ste14
VPAIAASRLPDLLARAVVGVLFALFSIHLLEDFQRTRHLTGLLLLISEALIVPLMIFRRRALVVDRTLRAWVVTTISIVGPPLLRPAGGGLLPDAVTAVVASGGLALVIAGKVTLGRSFGIVPANRGIVTAGPYGLVRHPIYAGYIVSHAAFAVAHPSLWNVLVVLTADLALSVRALLEEKVLARDTAYQGYCSRVGWHLIPGVF